MCPMKHISKTFTCASKVPCPKVGTDLQVLLVHHLFNTLADLFPNLSSGVICCSLTCGHPAKQQHNYHTLLRTNLVRLEPYQKLPQYDVI